MRLTSATWTELSEGTCAQQLLLPLGATEQHGPHLPIGTDTVIVEALAAAVAEGHPDRVVGPVLPYGSSGEHRGFPGTLSIGQDALEHVVIELVRSADCFAGVIILSWHGGNGPPLGRASRLLRDEGRVVRVWTPALDGADLHAGRTETSLMLHLAPALVRPARPVGAIEPFAAIAQTLSNEGVRTVSASGVLGDATGASAEGGRAIFASVVTDLERFLARAHE